MDEEELTRYVSEHFPELEVYFMRRIEVDGIRSALFSADQTTTRTHPASMISVKNECFIDEDTGEEEWPWDSPYMYRSGDAIDEEVWVKYGLIRTVKGRYV